MLLSMLKKIISLALLILSPVSVHAQSIDGMMPVDVERECDVTIEFGSFTQTIDADTYAKIMERVNQRTDIAEKHAMNLQPNGGRTLCLKLSDGANGNEVYEDLKRFIPEEAKEGWEKITLKNGPSFQTKLTKKYTPYTWEKD